MLIPSKLSRPVRLQNTVIRERLLKQLSAVLNYRLTLLHCPPGYGKTTLIAQWAARISDLGWYSLDEGDNQPERFASYLIAAIQQATKGHCSKSEALCQKHQYANLNALFAQLFIELSDWQQPIYLVIDDYHLITHEAIHHAMRFFLRHQPDNLALIILSRTSPPLGIANLRVRDQLLEFDTQQLAFNHQETQQFFSHRLNSPLTQHDTDQLCDDVEGWVTALQLISLSARESSSRVSQSAKRLAGLNASHLADYLVEEVLDQIASEERDFLLRCSVLRSMNDRLINALTGVENGQQRLEELERQGLFTQRLDDHGEWFRLHPLFNSFLYQRCQWERPTEVSTLHRAAAKEWLAQGFASEAIYHTLASEDTDMLRQVLLQYGWSLFNQGELPLLENCFQALPYDTILTTPHLALLKAWLIQSQHRYNEVNQLLTDAEEAMQQHKQGLSDAQQAEFNALRAQVEINAGKPDKAEQLAHDALKYLPLSSYYSRIVATSVISEAYHCRGDLVRALAMMQQTEQMASRDQAYHYVLWALIQQSEILIAQGFLQAAYEMQDRAFALVEQQHLEQLPMHEFLLRLRAQVLWSWARYSEAEQAARQGIHVLSDEQPQQHLQCLAMLAKCALARGDLNNADNYLARCENLLGSSQYHKDWLTNTYKVLVLQWQLSRNQPAAQAWLENTEYPTSASNHFLQGQWRNIARALLLTEQYAEAEVILQRLNDEARQLRLVSDLNRNLLVSNLLYWHTERREAARETLIEALDLANRTGFISHFVIEGEVIAQQLRQLLQLNILPELAQHRAQLILREINQHHRHKFAHFDENFVEKLLTHPHVPELIRTSPLTQREWQILGLIYSGYSNKQIADELDVAATTIKTHIRNLYQKMGIEDRKEAVEHAQKLLEMLGYNAG